MLMIYENKLFGWCCKILFILVIMQFSFVNNKEFILEQDRFELVMLVDLCVIFCVVKKYIDIFDN